MKKEIANFYQQIKRPLYFVAVLVSAASLTNVGVVFADATGGQVQSRSIMMSDNAVSGSSITSGVGSGTNVTYRVTFTPASSYTLKGIILDFCSGVGATPGTPFIGDSNCPLPTNFSIGASPTVDVSTPTETPPAYTGGPVTPATGIATSSSWTASSLADPSTPGSHQVLKLTNADGIAVDPSTSYTFAISGITNPSDLGTFYGRLITYSSNTGDIDSYSHDNPGTYQDYGGFALSTANSVQVTAKVQETLSFCVVGTPTPVVPATLPVTPPATCADGSAPAITLGHGTNNTLDSGAIDTNGVFTFVSTNALHGVVIRMRNGNSNGTTTTCGGLSIDNGATCGIPPVAAGAVAASPMTNGTAAFGMFCNQATADAATHIGADVNCDSGYYNSSHVTAPNDVYWGMDTTDVNDSVISTYGDEIASSSGPTNSAMNEFDFAATASDTTPAGIYKANLAMIATGTF